MKAINYAYSKLEEKVEVLKRTKTILSTLLEVNSL